MQYLPDQFPPPASTGSCSRFLGIAHSWGDTVLCSRPRPAGHYGIGEATDFFFAGLVSFFFFQTHLPQASVVALCAIWEKEKIHFWIWWQCHLQNHSPEHVWGHWSRILLSFFVFCYILFGPLCWFIRKARSRCVFSLSFMWAVTCTCPSHNNSYPRLSHIWTGGYQSLGRLFKTNWLL